MAIKYREAEELRQTTRKNLTASAENWMTFLKTASNTYKYSYEDQLLISAQFPNAKAVAAFDVWSDRFSRKIRSGEKGIGLIDDSGKYPKMKYVFDISQSNIIYRNAPQPYLWDLKEEYQDDVALYLAGDLSIPIEQAISDFCENTVDSLLNSYEYELISSSADSNMLYGLDEMSVHTEFRQAVLESVKYMTLTRCGLDTDLVDKDVFKNLTNFSEVNITDILGTATSNISEQVLREIENTVKTIERRNLYEHNNQENENDKRDTSPVERGGYDILSDNKTGQADRFDIYSRSRNIRISSKPDSDSGREGHRQMGTQTQEVFKREQVNDVSSNVRQPHTDGSSDRGERSSRENDGRTDGSNDETRRRDRAVESNRPNGVGTQSQLDTEQSRRNSAEQSDLRIKQKQKRKKKKAEERVSPAFSDFKQTQGEQISLFDNEPTEQDRINEYAMSRLISVGTGFEDGKFRIQEFFSQEHTKAEKAKFLSDEFGWGGSYAGNEDFESRPGKGLFMKRNDKDNPENNITVHLTYPQVADMLDYLISNNLYIVQEDIERRQRSAIYTLKNANPDNLLDAYRIKNAKAILDSYNIDYSQLLANQPIIEEVTVDDIEELNATIADDTEIPDIDSSPVISEPSESVYTESAVVAEFRSRTDEKFHLIGDRTASDIEYEVEQALTDALSENEIVGNIKDVVLYGSRSRGLENSEQSDIDIVVEIDGAELKEDALFNIFAELNLDIDGIPVDVNPIRPEQTGTLEDYLPRAETYLEQKQAEQTQSELKVTDGVTISVGLSESSILNNLLDANEPLSYSAMNAVIEYLDEKQHLEKFDPLLKAGWYKKTNFEIKAIINGEEFNYSGRYDIGDGKGTGGGSITDHISDFVEYSLSSSNPLHLDDDDLAQQRKVKDILVPFLKENEELSPSDQMVINRIKYDYPIGITEERYKSLVGKKIECNSEKYTVEKIDLSKGTAQIRDDNTGWYPLFRDVPLGDVVEQNIDLILDDKERFFRDCDLPSLLSKSSLAYDEIKSLGYIFLGNGYINKHKPSEKSMYGTGFLKENKVYDIARRYQNGEDISRELADGLFGEMTSARIPFDDSHTLELKIAHTDTGYFVKCGAYSREISYEDMAKAYVQHFKNEYEDIKKEVVAENKKAENSNKFTVFGKNKSVKNSEINSKTPERTYKIYQLKDNDENAFKMFEGWSNQPEPVSITDYDLVYEGNLADINGANELENIYTKFNIDRPDDFKGHSLSISDVVVIEQDGQEQAYFVDRVGFQNVPDFFIERTKQQTSETTEKTENYRITDLSLGQRKLSEKFEDNLNAIKTLKQLEAEDRTATPSEQETLSKYTGWGGLSKVFEPDNKHYPEVKSLLNDDEFAAARKSTMTAFYTSPVIIKEMYAKLAEMGFNGGKLLEPSCGIGNFIGMIPGNNTSVTGIELDSLTGRIAQKLYPQAQIQVCGFENSKLKENSFDVAVGNVPFGDIRVYDKKYNSNNLLIHDYFFSKSLDMVKPGGVVAFITSKGTLDKLDKTARHLLAEKAEFLGAVRLPNSAFKANAGTEVTSDIIFLQKRTEPITITPENEPLWIKTATDENGIEMNAYFTEHPEQICGTMAMVSGQFGMESTCQPNTETKLSKQIRTAMGNIQGKIETVKSTSQSEKAETAVTAPESLRNSSYFLSDGKAYFYESGNVTPVNFSKSREKKSIEIMSGLTAIRDTVRQLLEMQLDEMTTDDEIKAVQATLSSLYDNFAKTHGRISDKANSDVFKNDSSLPLLKSLEKYDENGNYVGKADIFTKRTIKAEHTITEVSTSVDALAVSLSTLAKVDLDYMAHLTGFDKDKIITDLQGSIYKIPKTERYVTADEYLSGNILQKLETAQRAFDDGEISLAGNITALKKAMPERLSATDIDIRLGSTWIKPEYIRDFVYDLLKTPSWHKSKYYPKDFIDVQYSQTSGKWTITNKASDKTNVQARTTYGTADRTAYELIEDALNLKATQVKIKQLVDGKEQYVVNPTKTAQARAKQDLICQKFKEWIFADKTRRDDLVDTYNTIFNSSRPREYDGSHLNFVGMNPEIQLRPHQLNAVARCLYGGNTLLAHEVGAGKTYEMIAAAMEGKRLGLHRKSLICVPNHLTEQIGADFLKLYPNANILVATKKDFEKDNRKALTAKIATGNYDAIIIGHSQLEKIPLSQARQQQFIEYQIEETMRNIEELKAMKGERYQIKQAEKTKANLEAKLKKLLDSPKDDTVTFEELGIDKMFLDEAHLFKNLFLSTKMQNVSGISTSSDVQKTADLFMKTQYLDEITGGKGLVFATGTPVSNTMCEIYNMMRYLQMDLLREKHLEHFDSWASTFGENVTQMELTPEGNSYRAKTRFSKFFNLPELMAMFKECADIQTADTLNLPGIPECEVHNVAVEPTETQKALVDSLSKRAEEIHNRTVDPTVDNMLKLTTDGRKIGLDQRLINSDLPDEPGTKVNVCVDNVFRIWNESAENRGTQLIFCDYSTPKKDSSFNVYDDIKAKLIAKGVPEEQIAFIHDATNEAKREELFGKVRSGEIRVLIGSTQKMGAGTNVQDRLIASHDLDAPYRPADMEQRRGRMVRQGNRNSKVHLYRYCTKDTFDAYLFQMLERKQSFISQIMTSKSPQRRCDDVDEATLSYAEVKALCVGDPRIKEKMELDNEVGKLRLERISHQQEQYRLEDMLESIKKQIQILETNIPKNQNDFLFVQNHPLRLNKDGKKIFEGITLDGKTYTDKKEAVEAFKNACMTTIRQGGGHRDYVSVGEYRGFKIGVMFDSFSQVYQAKLSREGSYFFELGTDNFTRMDNVLDKLSDVCKERADRLSENKEALTQVKEQIGKPFAKEEEFKTKTARLAVLNAELDVDGKKNDLGNIQSESEQPKIPEQKVNSR